MGNTFLSVLRDGKGLYVPEDLGKDIQRRI